MAKHHTMLIMMLAIVTNGFAQDILDMDSLMLDSMINVSSQKVGYTNEDLKTLTGSIDKVTEERMSKGLVINSLDALNGSAAGVQVSTSNQAAQVNAVRVRGTSSLMGGNDPLVLIDGVTADIATLTTIYPADIESFTILKDASETAQYGSRGAAGVIQVTTKKGKSGQFHISYEGHVGFESIYKNIEMLNAAEFRQAAQNLGVDIIDKGYDTNFRDAVSRTGYVQNHHISFGGGTDKSYYRASVGLMDHKTVIKTNDNRNLIAKLDIHQKAFDDKLTVDLGMFGSVQKNHVIADPWAFFYSAACFNPTFPDTRNEQGEYDNVTEAWWIGNPMAKLDKEQVEENGHLATHLRMTIDLGKRFKLSAFGSYSYNEQDNSHFYPTYTASGGEAYRGNNKREELLGNLSLNYDNKWADRHRLEVLALTELQSKKTQGFYTTVVNFTTNAFGYDNLSAGAVRPWEGTSSYYSETNLASFLIRGKYSYLGRYTLTVNARADGSSKVGKNNRWGFFPSASAAWNVSDEKWFKNYWWCDALKVRAGYGLSGNIRAIDAYLSQQLIKPNGVVNVGGKPMTTLGVIRNANPDLKWEKKHTFNIGVDMAFWHGRIVLKVDHYRSRVTDMLYEYTVPVPPYTYNKLLANLGKMKSSGMEIGFGITPLRTKDMELNFNMNWSFERNKLISLNGYFNGEYLTTPSEKGISSVKGAGINGSSDVCIQMVGQPLGVFYLPHCTGLETWSDGSLYYETDGKKQICGQAMPKAVMNANIAFRYRQWDITMKLNGAFGHKIYNATKLCYMNMMSLPNYNVMKGAPEQNIMDQEITDYWLENGDYVNIDYVTIGWNVPLRSKHIQSLRLSCSVDNIVTFTGYSGLTPMINSSVVNSTLGLDDKLNYPVYRSFAFALSIRF